MRSLELRACDGVTSRPRDSVTSDVIGCLVPKLSVWKRSSGSRTLRRRRTWSCPWRIRNSSTWSERIVVSIKAVPAATCVRMPPQNRIKSVMANAGRPIAANRCQALLGF